MPESSPKLNIIIQALLLVKCGNEVEITSTQARKSYSLWDKDVAKDFGIDLRPQGITLRPCLIHLYICAPNFPLLAYGFSLLFVCLFVWCFYVARNQWSFSNGTNSFTWLPNHVESELLSPEIHISDPSMMNFLYTLLSALMTGLNVTC